MQKYFVGDVVVPGRVAIKLQAAGHSFAPLTTGCGLIVSPTPHVKVEHFHTLFCALFVKTKWGAFVGHVVGTAPA